MFDRLKILSLIFLLLFCGLAARLFYWQIIKGRSLSSEASNQYSSKTQIMAPRGNILAKDESWLAARGDAYLVFAELPKLNKSPKEIAEKLAPMFIEDKENRTDLLNEIDRLVGFSKKEVVWIALKQKISKEVKEIIEKDNIAGIGFEKIETRVYPEASVAAQLLGFVGKNEDGDNTGYFGLEGYYDLQLQGKQGFIKRESDARGNPILIGESKKVTAISGIDLVTNIDKTVQLSIEKRLKEGIERYGAKAGSVIVMNPESGAILGMASYPSYDPAKYAQYTNELFKNPTISSSFEPGSVFKVVVMASALDAGVVKPDTKCDICAEPLKLDKYYIKTWNNEYTADSTMIDVIVHSDNVGMSFVGQKLGVDKMYDYLYKFGFGKLTGIDLQGEASPKLREKGTWNIVDLATTSFGQGVAVTPIQMIRAVAIIANGGKMVTPQVVGKIKGSDWEETIKPGVGERVISLDAANDMKSMMVQAAQNGESKWTALRGFSVAGKTGTAQIPIAGHYDAEKTIASFVGFSPANKPKFVMLVTLSEPQTSTWASETAAPMWYAIAKDLFPYFGIQPNN